MKVSELLTDESKWTKGAFSRTIKGYAIGWQCDNAVCFCLSGAIFKCYNDGGSSYIAINKLRSVIGCENIAIWNDAKHRTFAEVREAVLKAGI